MLVIDIVVVAFIITIIGIHILLIIRIQFVVLVVVVANVFFG